MLAPAKPFDSRLVGSRVLSPGVRELVFERADSAPMHFEPGQWVNLVLPLPAGELKRAYSIASAPEGSARFEIAVTRVEGGPGSEYLHDLEPGALVHAIGPHGLFTRAADDPTPSLFVATGTGVTPLRSMIQAALQRGSTAPMWLLFGARFEQDILYLQEFEDMVRSYPHVRYEVTLSQPGAGWSGRQGYVQRHLPAIFRELAERAAPVAPQVYICGLERMVKAVRDIARNELGADRKHVHTERYD